MISIYGHPSKTISQDVFLKRVEDLEFNSQVPLNDNAFHILDMLSAECLSTPLKAEAPQLIALGFWLRKANLNRIISNSELGAVNSERSDKTRQTVYCSRGIAFHLPPANVDTLFVYSWALSLLSGNANIVRLPTVLNATGEWLISTITKILKSTNEDNNNLFCQFEKESEYVKLISELSDLRMIWGGDAKVRIISKFPVRPDGLSLGFPDRQSLSIISVTAYSDLDDKQKNALAEKFFNDVFWFDQMGCSSPRALIWHNEKNNPNKEKITLDFYTRLQNVIKNKKYETEVGVAIAKFSFMNQRFIEHDVDKGKRISNELSISSVKNTQQLDISKFHGGGHIYECFVKHITEIAPLTNRSTQTISYFGLSTEHLKQLSDNISARGGYRIVPIGTALNFDETWDGISLLSHMCRKIIIQT